MQSSIQDINCITIFGNFIYFDFWRHIHNTHTNVVVTRFEYANSPKVFSLGREMLITNKWGVLPTAFMGNFRLLRYYSVGLAELKVIGKPVICGSYRIFFQVETWKPVNVLPQKGVLRDFSRCDQKNLGFKRIIELTRPTEVSIWHTFNVITLTIYPVLCFLWIIRRDLVLHIYLTTI